MSRKVHYECEDAGDNRRDVPRERLSRPGARLWSRESVGEVDRNQAILPDGCVDVIWLDGELLVAGPDTVAQQTTIRATSRYRAIRLPPGMGPAVLGVPAHEIRDARPLLAELWPPDTVRRWADQLFAASAGEQYLLLERLVAERLAQNPVPAATSAIATAITGAVAVADIAECIGWNERRLLRHCRGAFGYGPQTLRRILRFDRAVRAARSGTPLADVAAATGYADQAHLAREARNFGGAPLSRIFGPAARARPARGSAR